jgi:catechol 2,3-dioxygenase-like lactoylglutathione lyase family enzyme
MAVGKEKTVSYSDRKTMKISHLDHITITTVNLDECIHFYVDLLGMEHRVVNGHHNFYFDGGKISVHTRTGEFQPAALCPTYGSQDFCLIVDGSLDDVKTELLSKGAILETDIVERHGAKGLMKSLYLRDPDGNLIELSSY